MICGEKNVQKNIDAMLLAFVPRTKLQPTRRGGSSRSACSGRTPPLVSLPQLAPRGTDTTDKLACNYLHRDPVLHAHACLHRLHVMQSLSYTQSFEISAWMTNTHLCTKLSASAIRVSTLVPGKSSQRCWQQQCSGITSWMVWLQVVAVARGQTTAGPFLCPCVCP